jgi:hypothetical protein
MLIYFLTFLATYERVKGLKAPDNILETIIEIDIKEYHDNSKEPY